MFNGQNIVLGVILNLIPNTFLPNYSLPVKNITLLVNQLRRNVHICMDAPEIINCPSHNTDYPASRGYLEHLLYRASAS